MNMVLVVYNAIKVVLGFYGELVNYQSGVGVSAWGKTYQKEIIPLIPYIFNPK